MRMTDFKNLQLFGQMEDEAIDILHDINEEYGRISPENQIEIAKLAQMIRIADCLSEISEKLSELHYNSEMLERLTECVSTNDIYGSRFCITGDVTSYEP